MRRPQKHEGVGVGLTVSDQYGPRRLVVCGVGAAVAAQVTDGALVREGLGDQARDFPTGPALLQLLRRRARSPGCLAVWSRWFGRRARSPRHRSSLATARSRAVVFPGASVDRKTGAGLPEGGLLLKKMGLIHMPRVRLLVMTSSGDWCRFSVGWLLVLVLVLVGARW